MQFVAELKFRGNDAECERLYKEYMQAKSNLKGYLMKEGIDFGLELERKEIAPSHMYSAVAAACKYSVRARKRKGNK